MSRKIYRKQKHKFAMKMGIVLKFVPTRILFQSALTLSRIYAHQSILR